jgi:hypothetical protein
MIIGLRKSAEIGPCARRIAATPNSAIIAKIRTTAASSPCFSAGLSNRNISAMPGYGWTSGQTGTKYI